MSPRSSERLPGGPSRFPVLPGIGPFEQEERMTTSDNPLVRIASDVRLGRNVRFVGFVNLYGCTIGDDTFIGPFVEIQSDVEIGARCKIQSHSFICSGVTI